MRTLPQSHQQDKWAERLALADPTLAPRPSPLAPQADHLVGEGGSTNTSLPVSPLLKAPGPLGHSEPLLASHQPSDLGWEWPLRATHSNCLAM